MLHSAVAFLSPSRLISYSSPFFLHLARPHRHLHSFPTRRSSDLSAIACSPDRRLLHRPLAADLRARRFHRRPRSEEHTSELQSLTNLVCRLLLEKKKKKNIT